MSPGRQRRLTCRPVTRSVASELLYKWLTQAGSWATRILNFSKIACTGTSALFRSIPEGNEQIMKPMSVHITRLCWAYLVAAVLLWLTLRLGADRWWVPTIITYGPRWIWAVPAIGLLPLAIWFRRRMAWVAVGGAMVVLFGVMGFTI